MRKVYHTEKSPVRLAMAVMLGVGLAGVVFGILPFSHMIAKPSRALELRKASAADVPPPIEEKDSTPPPEADKPPEAPPEPKLVDAPLQIPLIADLDVAVGSGGGLEGFGEVRKLTATESVQEEAFDVSDLDRRAEPVSQVSPVYPPELRKAKIEGRVTLAFVVTEDGRVEDPRVENSSRPEFEKPALDAVRRWRFRPGEKDGKPVRAFCSLPMRFHFTR